MTHAPPETPFWRFSLRFYRQAGVADACIALQDGCGVDVNVLLFLFWLASMRRRLTAADVEKLDEEVRPWRELTVLPIRAMRRSLKTAATVVPAAMQEQFRGTIKTIELEAERLQQQALYDIARAAPLGAEAAPAAAARANVAAYEAVLGVTFPKPSADLLVGAFDRVMS